MPCRIELSDVELQLHIGCTEEERRLTQPVGLRITVTNPEKFPASVTDQLMDTVDVGALQHLIRECALTTRVHTLERLGQALEECLRQHLPTRNLQWELTVAKPRFGWAYVHSWTS